MTTTHQGTAEPPAEPVDEHDRAAADHRALLWGIPGYGTGISYPPDERWDNPNMR